MTFASLINLKDKVIEMWRFASKVQALQLLGEYLKLWEGAGNNRDRDRLHELVEAMQAPFYANQKKLAEGKQMEEGEENSEA